MIREKTVTRLVKKAGKVKSTKKALTLSQAAVNVAEAFVLLGQSKELEKTDVGFKPKGV